MTSQNSQNEFKTETSNDIISIQLGKTDEMVIDDNHDDYTELDDGKEIYGPFVETRKFIANILNYLLVRVIIIILIIADIIFAIVSVAYSFASVKDATHLTNIFDILSLVLICIFFFELCLRVFVELDRFGKTWSNIIDGAIISLTFLINVVLFVLNYEGNAKKLDIFKLLAFGRFIRLILLIRWIRLILQTEGIQRSMRLCVRGNKRGYQKDGYDLDLCYVTPRIIAMSFPSSGLDAVYRNKIEHVAKFLNEKHKNHYRVYNLCSERAYETHHFDDRVERVYIDDHNVPTLRDTVKFAKSVKAWMTQDTSNVIAIHCKGGKGRTGTMISVWLLESRLCKNADKALTMFGERRTDLDKGDTFQGVETPSQSRFVGYYDIITNKLGGELPPRRDLKLDKIVIHSIKGVGNSDGSDLFFFVYLDSKQLAAKGNLGNNFNCEAKHDPKTNSVVIEKIDCETLHDEVKMMFNSNHKNVPKYYDDCAFFFTFHTSFVEQNRLFLKRNELDNPHKTKFWNVYNEDFALELLFKNA